MAKVKLAIPKGSLEKQTFEILEKAWYRIYGAERTYRPIISDPEIELKMLRPQEIPILVQDGLYDVGITGKDWVLETGADAEVLLDLKYGGVKVVFALPENLRHYKLSYLLQKFKTEKRSFRISTEYLNITSQWLMRNTIYKKLYRESEPLQVTPWWRKGSNKNVAVSLSFGATEAKPPEEADAIVDASQTGTTLEQNKLRVVETIMESTAVLLANNEALEDKQKREKIFDIMTLLKGVIDAAEKLHIFVNVKKENLNKLLLQLPALKRPTISPLSDKGWYSVNTVVEKKEFLRLIPTLRKLAQGLVVHEPKQILSLEEIARNESERRVSP